MPLAFAFSSASAIARRLLSMNVTLPFGPAFAAGEAPDRAVAAAEVEDVVALANLGDFEHRPRAVVEPAVAERARPRDERPSTARRRSSRGT